MADLEKLKALANEAIADECWEPLLGLTGAETEFAKAASPDAVLELIAELERLRSLLGQCGEFLRPARDSFLRAERSEEARHKPGNDLFLRIDAAMKEVAHG